MSNIRVDLYLRPIRFAFLVRPDDIKSTLEIFKINSCLWGGKFNPIIPYFKRLPIWWEKNSYKFENAKQVINGYFDFFEPDFLVEAEKGLADEYGFDPQRVIQLDDIFQCEGERGRAKYGLSVHDLYMGLYKREFQFQRRCQPNIVQVKAKDKAFENFVACNFGSFFNKMNLKYLEEDYKEVFNPVEIELDANVLYRLYESDYCSALTLGHAEIKVNYYEHSAPTLFILDAHQPRDLIDFWNLRAVYRNVVAIPIEWIKELSPFCKNFILDNYRPIPGNPNRVMINPISMFSRSISEQDIKEIYQNYLQVDKVGANLLRTWYPPIWHKSPESMVRTTRPTLKAASNVLDVVVDSSKPSISFSTLFPEFANQFGNRIGWANVVRLNDYSFKDQVATVFPCDYKNSFFLKLGLRIESLLATTEGLVIFPEYRGTTEHWELINGTAAFNTWFENNNITATPSDAGRATQQIVQTLGGFLGVNSLAYKGVVQLLDEMSRKPTKSVHFQDFQNKINVAVTDDMRARMILETLVKQKVVELGLHIKCSKCSSSHWYSLKALDYSLICKFCLQQFNFPIIKPKDAKWAYRVIGAFAQPEYARGGYAASLAIRFFAHIIGKMHSSEITWSTAQELTLLSSDKIEADFILWSQRKQMFGLDYPTETVFGETKSFATDAFKRDEIDKMKSLAKLFPGSILVFATMKDPEELSKKELERIRKLAEWGREYDRERKQSRAPVILLTGIELFIPFHLAMTWEEKGGKHKELIKPAWVSTRLDNLRVLADLTQQLYLGMPSYGKWLEVKWQKKLKK